MCSTKARWNTVSRQFVSCRVTKQRPDHFGGTPKCLFPREKSLLEQGFYLTAGISGANRGRRLKVLPPTALLSVQHLSPLLTGIQSGDSLVPGGSRFELFQVSGVWTLLVGVRFRMEAVACCLWSARSSTCLSSPRCVGGFHPCRLFCTLFISFNWELRSPLLTTSDFSPGTIMPADMLVLFISFITYLILFINYIVFGYIDVPYFILYNITSKCYK